ncbi:MAG: flagellar assembly protein FliW [Bacillaceae bacterium]|nr:MAG: flagellar assembly protein FliW [Bacillaceae bacterium]
MRLKTKYHGEIEAASDSIIQFPSGIPGFLDEKEFVLLPFGAESPFFILQSVNTKELAFVMTIPFLFFKDYAIDLDDATIEQLEIESEQDVAVYVILTVEEPFKNTTANLLAPVIINQKNKRAKQVILTGTTYKTKHPLMEQKEV